MWSHEESLDRGVPEPDMGEFLSYELFSYVKAKDQWIEHQLPPEVHNGAREQLARELDTHIQQQHERSLRVTARSHRVYKPYIEQRGDGSILSGARLLSSDEGDAGITGAHEVDGELHGFYVDTQSDESELIAQIRRDEQVVRTRTGIHTPLWGVPVKESTFEFHDAARRAEEERCANEVRAHLYAVSGTGVGFYYKKSLQELLNTLERDGDPTVQIHEVGRKIEELQQAGDPSYQLIDTIALLTELHLRFDEGVTMDVTSYRILNPEGKIRGYRQGGARTFNDVQPRLQTGTMGGRQQTQLSFTCSDGVIQVATGSIRRVGPVEESA